MEAQKTNRITLKYLGHSIIEAFDLKRGLLFTFRELSINPGVALLKYIEGDRKLTNPFKYMLFVLSLSVAADFLHAHFNPSFISAFEGDLLQIVQHELYFYMPIILAAFMIYLLNLKRKYNYLEYFVVTIYLGFHLGIILLFIDLGQLVLSLVTGNMVFISQNVVFTSYLVIGIPYFLWAIMSFLKISFIKSLLVVLMSIVAALAFVPFSRAFIDPFLLNDKVTMGIHFDLPEEEKMLYRDKAHLAWQTTLQVDSVVVNGPGWTAGIKKGDTILKVNNKKTNWAKINYQIADYEQDESVLLTIRRKGKAHNIPVTFINEDSLKLMME